jgi:hypothetical protein
MKHSFCSSQEKQNLSTIINKPTIDDIAWLEAKNISFAQLILSLIQKDSEKYKLIKVQNGQQTILFYLLEIININLGEIYNSKPGMFSKISKHLLSFCKFKIAHPSYSLLYDFDFIIADHGVTDKYLIVAKSLETIEKDLGIHIVTLPCGTHQNDSFSQNIIKLGYEKPIDDFTMQLSLDSNWESLSDYVNYLKRKYSKRAKSILKKSDSLTFRELNINDILEMASQIHELYSQVLAKQKFIAGTADSEHFVNLKRNFGDDFRFEGIFDINNNLLAFLSYFKKTNALHIHYVGLDYAKNDQYDIYFNILFRCIELGIKNGKNTINFGRTSLDAKASLGAEPIAHQTFVKTNGLSKLIKKCVVQQIAKLENNSWKLRKPFKSDVTSLEEA